MESVTASAPGKLLLYGDHAVVHGFPCIVTAVDQRMHVSVQKIKETNLVVNAPDLQITAYSKPHQELGKKNIPKSVAFIETCYKHFLKKYPQTHGILVSTKTDFSSQFGF